MHREESEPGDTAKPHQKAPIVTVTAGGLNPAGTAYLLCLSHTCKNFFTTKGASFVSVVHTNLNIKEVKPRGVFHFHVECTTKTGRFFDQHIEVSFFGKEASYICECIMNLWFETTKVIEDESHSVASKDFSLGSFSD
jgi:hypothetical protein